MKLIGEVPVCTGTDIDNPGHRLYVGPCFDSQGERFGYCRGNSSNENIVDDFNNFTRAVWPNMKNILFLAHGLEDWQYLLKYLAFPANHDRERPVHRAL